MSARLPGPTGRTAYRLALAGSVTTMLLLVWSVGALGIVGAGGSSDRPYLVVPVVAVVGSALARLRARGMAVTAGALSALMLLVSTVVLLGGDHEDASVVDVVGITAMFATLFAVSAWLFHRAAGAGSTSLTRS